MALQNKRNWLIEKHFQNIVIVHAEPIPPLVHLRQQQHPLHLLIIWLTIDQDQQVKLTRHLACMISIIHLLLLVPKRE